MVEGGTFRRLFQKPNVSLRFGFACVIWDKVEQFGGSPHSSLFHSHFAMYQYHWKQNIPSAWCYHHRAWQLAQCSYFWKPPNIPLLPKSQSSIFVLSHHKMFLQKALGLSTCAAEKVSWGWRCQFWSRGFYFFFVGTLQTHGDVNLALQRCWCSRSFQFMAHLCVGGSCSKQPN